MNVIKTDIPDLLIIEPKVFKDSRGFFFESYNKEKYQATGITTEFVQDNLSKSSFGVVRGLHYQLAPYAQSKLVQVLEGEVYDVAVDLRKNSPTFGKSQGILLNATNKKQFFIPKGFAHGFSVLSEIAVFSYKCDSLYNKESERGIIYNDPMLNLDWGIKEQDMKVSEKDSILPIFENAEMNFVYE